LNGNPPLVYEDGRQSRDLIYVKDVVQALLLAMTHPHAAHEVFNVGTGIAHTILEVAQILSEKINPSIQPQLTRKFRAGDVRHIIADISKISNKLGFTPQYSFEEGITELLSWLSHQKLDKNLKDKSGQAKHELEKKGLL
jgi:dTDP-L-rhamnose 4-epimerase